MRISQGVIMFESIKSSGFALTIHHTTLEKLLQIFHRWYPHQLKASENDVEYDIQAKHLHKRWALKHHPFLPSFCQEGQYCLLHFQISIYENTNHWEAKFFMKILF